MIRKATLLLLPVVATMLAVGCKPIPYYLERVDKAYGKVTEAATGVPLESVEVVLGTYQYTELTNGLGDYELELAEGTWTLHFVKDGYVTVDRVVTVNASNPRVKVDAQLTPVGPPPPTVEWLIGSWSNSPLHAPFSDTAVFDADGTLHHYMDGVLVLSGTWSLQGNKLTFGIEPPIVVTINRISDDLYTLGPPFNPENNYRNTAANNIFVQAETVLSVGVWAEGSIEVEGMKLFSFTAPSAGNYDVLWEDGSDFTGHTASIWVAAYKSDQITPLFIPLESSPPVAVLGAGQRIFIIVGCQEAGTFRIKVQ